MLIEHDVSIQSTFCVLRPGIQYRSLWQQQSRLNNKSLSRVQYFVFKQCRYENRTPSLRPKLCSTCVQFGRREIQQVEVNLPGVTRRDCSWTPADRFGKITLFVCHDTSMYCYSCYSSNIHVASRQILAHATDSISPVQLLSPLSIIIKVYCNCHNFWMATGVDIDAEH